MKKKVDKKVADAYLERASQLEVDRVEESG